MIGRIIFQIRLFFFLVCLFSNSNVDQVRPKLTI